MTWLRGLWSYGNGHTVENPAKPAFLARLRVEGNQPGNEIRRRFFEISGMARK
jgi:hypothetical protein